MRSKGTDGAYDLVEFIPPGAEIYILFKLVYIAVAVWSVPWKAGGA